MECRIAKNLKNCNCTYGACSKQGICCECVSYHRAAGELPACFFPSNIEKTYDRSYKKFADLVSKGLV